MEAIPQSLRGAIEEFVRTNPDAMVTVVDSSERFRYASETSSELFGYAPAEIVGRKLSEFFGSLDIAHLRLVMQDALLNFESIKASRYVRVKFGGTKCMRGPMHSVVDPDTGQAYALAIGRPCEQERREVTRR